MTDMRVPFANEALTRQLTDTLARQRKAYFAHPVPTYQERRDDLRTLERFMRDNKEAMIAAVNADYGNRSRHETLLAEVFPALDAIAQVGKHLRGWMKPRRRAVDLRNYFGAKNRVIAQPLGVVGVITPWNFPINLTMIQLAYIFAAGNRAMVKMSENSRHLAKLLIDRMPAYFPPEKLQFFDETGGVGVEFSKLPFDHLIFTGSGTTGRAVMAAAAKNLCPVTLELGGKAPAIVCDDYPLELAAERILFVKYLNGGQICTTVDYAWIPEHKLGAFVELAKKILPKRYPTLETKDYTSIIDERAFDRLVGALEEARSRGATVVQLLPGKAYDRSIRKIAPHIVFNAPEDCELMQREIFGPILPLRTFKQIDTAIDTINAGPRPLAVYPFSYDKRVVQTVLDRVMSGGVSVNDALFHVGQHDLPFGGVGDSGMGHYHGHEGFETFSKMRPVFYQARFSTMKFLMPPYGKFADRVLNFLVK